MKIIKWSLPLAIIVIATFSCTDPNQENARTSLSKFENYVDSVSKEVKTETSAAWEDVENNYEKLRIDTKAAINEATDKEKLENEMEEVSIKWNNFKKELMVEKEKMDSKNVNAKLLFGEAYVSDNMQFNWVNKNNILNVFENFINTVESNKDLYSKEDWDEIKGMYEALDTRKNTVESEGLSSEDNVKIAGLKLKFSTMYSINRMTAKSNENI